MKITIEAKDRSDAGHVIWWLARELSNLENREYPLRNFSMLFPDGSTADVVECNEDATER